jgi:hypothetical protein
MPYASFYLSSLAPFVFAFRPFLELLVRSESLQQSAYMIQNYD